MKLMLILIKYKYLEKYMEVLANENDVDKLVEVVTAIAKE